MAGKAADTDMKRILVFGMTENPGGVESFLINYYRHIDRSKLQFDFLCNSFEPIAYEEELIELGARTFHITARRENRRKFYKELEACFAKHANEWSAIWVNVCSLANIDYLKAAKKHGIKKRIIHSHNSENMDSFARGVLHRFNKLIISKYATDFWACSEAAADWFYKRSLMDKVVIIHNAIDVRKFRYDPQKRKEIRDAINLSEDVYIIGNVGRLHFQKNQAFAINVFNEFLKEDANSRLVLVGQGEDENALKEKCAELGLNDKVLFTGIQSNVEGWLSAFDLLLFPSVFEGLSIVPLEAQANSLPVLASEGVIPKEAKICDGFHFFSLQKSVEEWSKEILCMKKIGRSNDSRIRELFKTKGYDIETAAEKLEKLFLT